MADEIINIASFDLDTSRLEKSLDVLIDRKLELTKVDKDYSNQIKLNQKEIDTLTKLNGGLINESSKYYEKVQELNKENNTTYKLQQRNAIQLSAVRSEYNATAKQIQANLDIEGKRLSLSELSSAALGKEINSINEARESNKQLNSIRNQLNPAIEEEAALLKQLNDQLDSNNDFIKENSDQYAQQKINIGNYANEIRQAAGDLNIFNGGLAGFAERAQEAGGAGNLVTNSLGGMAKGFVGVTKASLAFIATPVGAVITALVVVFGAIKNAMNRSEKATQSISKIFSVFSGVVNLLLDAIVPLGEYFINSYVETMEKVGAATEKAMKMISDGLRFLGFDKAAKSVDNFTESTKASIKEAQALADAERDLEIAQRQARITQLEYQKQAEKLRQIRDDESKSLGERVQANKDLAAVLDKQLNDELRIAKVALTVAELRIKQSGRTKEALDEQANALTQIADIEERITGQKSEQLANENSLRKEAAAKELENIKRIQDAALLSMKVQLDTYIENQGERKLSMEDELKFAEVVKNKSIAIAREEYKQKKLTKEQFDLEILKINNDFLKRQTDLTIENAQLELDELLFAHQRKLDQNTFFNEELYQQEVQRLQKIRDAEAAHQKLLLDSGKINQLEYNAAIRQIDEENRVAQAEATTAREEAQKEKEAADFAIKMEANASAFDTSLELQQEQFDIESQQRREAAEKAGADMIAFEKNEAKKRTDIETIVQNNKVKLASQAFGNIASILGEASAAGKAAAIAQTTIDTYQSATAAYKSMSGIPVVGPALGAVAAGAAVVSGLANVKKILSVDTKTKDVKKAPGYALGGVINSGVSIDRPNGDNVLIAAKLGEVMLNDSQQRSIGYANIAAAGVQGLSSSGNISVQNSLESNVNTAQMANIIAEAVMIGAERGSAKGSSDGIERLSSNRQIMENAKF